VRVDQKEQGVEWPDSAELPRENFLNFQVKYAAYIIIKNWQVTSSDQCVEQRQSAAGHWTKPTYTLGPQVHHYVAQLLTVSAPTVAIAVQNSRIAVYDVKTDFLRSES